MPPFANNTQAMRAILLASATAASLRGLRASSARNHSVICRPPGRTAALITEVAPVTSSTRNRSLPARLIPPIRCLPPVECSFGVRPAVFQSAFSSWSVPEASSRLIQGACLSATFFSAASADVSPLIPAGSLGGGGGLAPARAGPVDRLDGVVDALLTPEVVDRALACVDESRGRADVHAEGHRRIQAAGGGGGGHMDDCRHVREGRAHRVSIGHVSDRHLDGDRR